MTIYNKSNVGIDFPESFLDLTCFIESWQNKGYEFEIRKLNIKTEYRVDVRVIKKGGIAVEYWVNHEHQEARITGIFVLE